MSAPICWTSRKRGRLAGGVLAAASTAFLPAMPVLAQAVVQQLPDPAAAELSEALRRLTGDPQSVTALLQAGRASLQLGDIEAAAGFFARAEAIAPYDGRVMAGLAQVALARQDGVLALQLFERASAAGEPGDAHAADRALAYDLVGLNTEAQHYYALAMSRGGEDAEIVRRLALSYAIAGDHAAAEATLLPLLQSQDLAAYRTRAFALAIGGRTEEAVSIAETMLPARIAQRLAPYLRYMTRLTRAQQAAAANFGTFPAPADVGRDDPAVAALAAGGAPPPIPPPRGADSRLIPGGAPLGPPVAQTAPGGELAPLAGQGAAGSTQATGIAALQPVAAEPEPSSGGTLAAAGPSAVQQPGLPPADPSPSTPAPPVRGDLSQSFADFERPAGLPTGPVSADAVDVTRIVPAREEPPEPAAAQPRLPLNPSRHWVQLATGQDVANFRYDWMRIVRVAQGRLDGRQPYYAAWGANNRLVTGPFASQGEAQEFVTALGANGVASFIFTSASGERVIPLP